MVTESRRSLDVVVPVYGNADSLPQLLIELAAVAAEAESRFGVRVRAVFVVDGSPDDSLAVLQRSLPAVRLESTLIDHSRNFGSFAAIRTGLAATSADWYCSRWPPTCRSPPNWCSTSFAPSSGEPTWPWVRVRHGTTRSARAGRPARSGGSTAV